MSAASFGMAATPMRLLDDMGCQPGVEPAKLTTVMKMTTETNTKSYATIKLGIDAHSKWYQPPFAPLRSGPRAASRPSRQKQIPSSSGWNLKEEPGGILNSTQSPFF